MTVHKVGPTLVTPPQPQPYYSCDGCEYFSSYMIHSGGLNGSSSYSKDCKHKEFDGLPRSLDGNRNLRGTANQTARTPNWCPVLIDFKEEEKMEEKTVV